MSRVLILVVLVKNQNLQQQELDLLWIHKPRLYYINIEHRVLDATQTRD